MFNAIQVYDIFLKDKQAGIDKYFEACACEGDTYEEVTEKLGLVSAFDDNAAEYLKSITMIFSKQNMALIMIRHLIILKTVHIWERFFLPNKKYL